MSLILDALKRAERERRGETTPAPEVVSMPVAGTRTPRERPRWLGHVVVAGGLALGGVLIWDAFRAPPPPAPEPAAVAPAPAPAPAPIKARPAPPASPTVVPGTEDVASLDDLTDEPELELAPPPAGAAAPAPKKPVPAKPAPAKPAAKKPAPAKPAAPQPAPLTDAESPRTAAVETVPAPPPQAGEVRPSEAEPPAPAAVPEAAAPAPATQVPPALTQPAPLRKFREMPPDYRADFPALRVEIHVYESAPARRFVMINGKRYREGERMAEGPVLVEIVPDGMVLDYRGEKVLYTLSR